MAIWWVLTELFHGHAVTEFEDELDHHGTELINLLQVDAAGGLMMRTALSNHRFLTPHSGCNWQAELPNGTVLRSQSLGGARLALQLDFTRVGAQRDVRLTGPTG